MNPIVFPAVCATGAVLSLLPVGGRRGVIIGPAAFLLACGSALLTGPADSVSLGGVRLDGSTYAGSYLAFGSAAALLLSLVDLASGRANRRTTAATLAALAALGLAFTSTDPSVSLLAAGIAAVTGSAAGVAAGSMDERPDRGTAEARATGLIVASMLFAGIAVARPSWTGADGGVIAAAFAAVAAGLAVRSGSVPFHLQAARLAKRGASTLTALLLVWIPAGLGLVALGWSQIAAGVRSDWLDAAVAAVQAVALLTLVLGSVGALLHDDPSEVAVYSTLADSGFLLLALASRNAESTASARLWLLVFVVAKTALMTWAGAVGRAPGSTRLGSLSGWIRRDPTLGLVLVAIAVATIGWPGNPVFEARQKLVATGLPPGFGFVGIVVAALSIAYYGRALLTGLLPSSGPVLSAGGAASGRVSTAAASEPSPVSQAGSQRERGAGRRARAPAIADAEAFEPTLQLGGATGNGRALPQAGSETAGDPGRRERARLVWATDRISAVSLVAVVSALLALAVGMGGLGATGAATGGIPLDAAAAAAPTPGPSPQPTPTPMPTLPPHATLGPLPSPSGETPSGGIAPSPTRSAAPASVPLQ